MSAVMERMLRAQTDLRTLKKYNLAAFDNGLALIPRPDSACFQPYVLCKEPTHGGVALGTQLLRVHLLPLIPVSSETLKNSFVSLLTVHHGVPQAPYAWLYSDISSRWPRLWHLLLTTLGPTLWMWWTLYSTPHPGCGGSSTMFHTVSVTDSLLCLTQWV